jgi:hypothetical protein
MSRKAAKAQRKVNETPITWISFAALRETMIWLFGGSVLAVFNS